MNMKSMNRLEDMVKSGRLTEMGKVIREKRIERKERLHDMAKKIDCTSSFLSGFEIGGNVSDGIFKRILREYDFTQKEREIMIADYILRTRRIPEFMGDLGEISKLIAREVAW